MNVRPVIDRELRTQARLGFNYLLRVLSAAGLLIVSLVFCANYGFSAGLGPLMFSYLNCTLFVSIWVLVPLLSADCVSRERREGTIGLLFLTPLRARDIVFSKGMVHGLRSLTIWLSVLPILTIAFLLGGVTWKEAALSVLMNFSSICWALAAGVLASSFSKTWLRSLLLAGGLSVCFWVAFILLVGATETGAIGTDAGFQLPFPYQYTRWRYTSLNWYQWMLPAGFFGATDGEMWWGTMFGALTRKSQKAWMLAECKTALLSVMLLLSAVMISAWNLRRSWQEEPPSARRIWLTQKFCTPVVGVTFFKRWLRRKLEHNPIGWLEQRTWTGRLVTWGWFAVLISFYSAVFYAPNANELLSMLQLFMAWSLLGLMGVSSAGSFQRERETRVLELLLVSPMSTKEIIGGRLRGLWGQFLPSFVLLVGVWGYLEEIFRYRRDFGLIPYFCGGYIIVPIVGLYYSLRRANFMSSFLSTLIVGLLMPQLLRLLTAIFVQILFGLLAILFGAISPDNEATPLTLMNSQIESFLGWSYSVWLFQVGIGFWTWRRLHQNLVKRTFAFATN